MSMMHNVSLKKISLLSDDNAVYTAFNGNIIIDLKEFDWSNGQIHSRIRDHGEFAIRNGVKFLRIVNSHKDFMDDGNNYNPDDDDDDDGISGVDGQLSIAIPISEEDANDV